MAALVLWYIYAYTRVQISRKSLTLTTDAFSLVATCKIHFCIGMHDIPLQKPSDFVFLKQEGWTS